MCIRILAEIFQTMKSGYSLTCTGTATNLHRPLIFSIYKLPLRWMQEYLPFIHALLDDTLKCIIISNFNKPPLIIITEKLVFIVTSLSFLYCIDDGIYILSVHNIKDVLVCIQGQYRLQSIKVIKILNAHHSTYCLLWNTYLQQLLFWNASKERRGLNYRSCRRFDFFLLFHIHQLASLSMFIPNKLFAHAPSVCFFMVGNI